MAVSWPIVGAVRTSPAQFITISQATNYSVPVTRASLIHALDRRLRDHRNSRCHASIYKRTERCSMRSRRCQVNNGSGPLSETTDHVEQGPPPGRVAVLLTALSIGILLMGIQLWLLT